MQNFHIFAVKILIMKKARHFVLILFFPLLFSATNAQPWMSKPYLEKSKSEANFYDIQKAFYTYWGDQPYLRSKGYKSFKRWEYHMEPKCYPDGKIPDPMKYYSEYKKFVAGISAENRTKAGVMWTPLGLNSWTNGNSGYNPGNGRLNAVTVDMNNRNNIYVAAPSGGIWITKDGGMSWNTTFDTMPVLGTSAVAIHPDNSNIIFIGTGDRDAMDTQGTGIYKSLDGGSTWSSCGLNFNPSYRNINKILINPQNPNKMLAACSDGIYRSKNGGSSWLKIYSGGEVKDLKYKPNDTNVIYGSGKYFVRSVNGGNSFFKNTITLPYDTVRIEIDVTVANPEFVYAVVSNSNSSFEGVYRSTDGGQTFVSRCHTPNILGYSEDGTDDAGQAWYDLAIAVSPNNANEVYVGGINVWKSTDGGANFEVNTMWYTGSPFTYIHCDIHSLNFYGDTLYCGSDGGIFYTADHGASWVDISEGLGISQFYGMGGCEGWPYIIAAGAQDVGSNVLRNGQWTHVFGADGMDAIVNNFDPQNIYVSFQSGGLLRSYDGGENFDDARPNDSISGNWVTPYVMHPSDGNLLFAGFDDVYKTTDGALSWTQISNNLANGFDIDKLAVAASNSNYIYASESEFLFVTTDGGAHWNTTTPAPNLYISGITVDPENPQRIWLSLTSYYEDRVLYSADAGITFTNITGNLTQMGFNCIAFQKNANNALYLGTEIGVFYTDSTLTGWIPYNYDLPNVKISELELNYTTGLIRAATYGRGIWEGPLHNYAGIRENQKTINFSVFPNPANDLLHIQLNTTTKNHTEIMLFNVVGTLTRKAEIFSGRQQLSIDISNLAPGTYFLKVSENNISSTKKIMIVH